MVTVEDIPLPVDRRPEPPAAFVIAGAGRVDVNGTFVRDGIFQGAHAYRRGAFRLTRRRFADGRDWWVVWATRRPEAAANDPLDDTFYRVRSSACLPPARGWESGRNGVLPPPLVAAGDATEADEGTNDAAPGTRNLDPAVREDEDDPQGPTPSPARGFEG